MKDCSVPGIESALTNAIEGSKDYLEIAENARKTVIYEYCLEAAGKLALQQCMLKGKSMEIWLWIIAAWMLTKLILWKKDINIEHYVWMLLPVDMYGVTIAGCNIKTIYDFLSVFIA